MTKATWLIKKLARELKYLSLSELFGRQVMIHSVDTVEDNIRHALGDIVPEGCRLLTEPQLMKGMLAKYDFLDLTFSVPAYLLQSHYESGISLLKALYFIRDPSQEDIDELEYKELSEFLGDDPTFLAELAEDVSKNMTVCRMILNSSHPREWDKNNRRMAMTASLPSGYFPQIFVIGDACITNALSVWLHKHFYL
ncbi:hypothetical protein IQ264_30275 [Phormidium sp. LEGE 05292]|uniref:hypothetical protein n=1 Tax=[Phormidium] sp. LEGE 05292 TaxID=767427 RepID=UPI00188280FC|nr:hypothetical protein [Phormidium sp. LEGE 05292]MBE9229693.1 hypothetical protein [Phormidium sp. LEGE 05292]